MAPFMSRAATSASMKGLLLPHEGVEKLAPGREWQKRGKEVKGG
jgi:hypothetical protein